MTGGLYTHWKNHEIYHTALRKRFVVEALLKRKGTRPSKVRGVIFFRGAMSVRQINFSSRYLAR